MDAVSKASNNFAYGTHLLLVDDEPDILYVIKHGVERKGVRVDAFADPREALDSFDPSLHSVALLDIKMPEMSGFELANELLKQKPDLQICFLTAFDINIHELRVTVPSIRPVCHLLKPMHVDSVTSHVQQCFVNSASQI